ncbi:MAG TPA: hypothetical protein VMP01_07870 [Pirellulaceae bacterium]|nr:hypothetical protein [Pirellulaceae bacterium]
MGLSFTDPDADSRPGKLRRVPDYTSRPVKMRLFVLVAAFILVLIVAERARDPKSWQWFFALDERPAPEKIDNRLPPRSNAAGDSDEFIVVAQKNPSPAVKPGGPGQAPAFDPEARAWSEGLQSLWNPLDSSQRTLLYRLLQTSQAKEIWPEAERASAAALLAGLAQGWSEYQRQAKESLADLDGDEQARWNQVLDTIDRRYRDDVAEPLTLLAEGRVVLANQRKSLAGFLADLDSLQLTRVEDDRPFLCAEDNQIWHHLFWQLQRTTDADLAARSQGLVPYAQLYRQPAHYRGQIVTVRGAVRRAYSVPASRNHLGIKSYFVYWIQPFESADTPLVVYALDVPPGFPPLKDRDRDGGVTKLDEEVTVYGFLFKRGAYAGEHGTYNAPLVLAKQPQWHPSAIGLAGRDATSPRLLWQTSIFALVLAVVITGVVYWTSFRRDRHPRPHDERTIAANLRSLQDEPQILSPHEALAQLEQQSQSPPRDAASP